MVRGCIVFKSSFNFDLASAHLLLSLWTREMKVSNNKTAPARAVIFQFVFRVVPHWTTTVPVMSIIRCKRPLKTGPQTPLCYSSCNKTQVQESSFPIQHNRRQHKEP